MAFILFDQVIFSAPSLWNLFPLEAWKLLTSILFVQNYLII